MPTQTNLTIEQKEQLIKIKRSHQSAIVSDRAHAVLLRNKGFTLAQTAEILFRSDQFVKGAVKRYKQGELSKLNFDGHNRKLTKHQTDEIIQIIRTQSPKELQNFKFNTQFWSTDILRQVIKNNYDIEYKTDNSYYDLFKQAGFSFKKPKTKDFRQDPEKIKEWKGALKKNWQSTNIRLSW